MEKMSEWLNPGSNYRSKVFWAWNGKLESDRLCRQIGNMAKMGLGGFFIHARSGLSTKYLSDEWFECVSASVEKARELHLEAWLYDEDRWPSGAAGGLVTRNKDFRARCLKMSLVDTPAADAIASFAAESGYCQFLVEIAQPCSWYNNQTYIDVFNPEAVKCFIETTHEAYRERYQNDFGGVIPGIFTDEPYYGCACLDGSQGLPWTERMPELFKVRYGYDLLPELPLLFNDDAAGRHCRVRYHFHALLTELFMENFMRRIYEWCDLHKLQFTGHMSGEDQLWTQAGMHGSSMRSYAYQHIPGIDHLTEYRGLYATIKQVTSAARQLGRRQRLSETYGCTGWDFPLAGHKAIGDIQFALGINQHCLHLYWYDMKGEGKRDFPASIGHQSSWWTEYHNVEDYFARLHAITSEGEEVRDILVINPVESMWLLIKSGWTCSAEKNFLDDDRRELQNRLLNAHLDFDYGDEGMMATMGRVIVGENGVVYLNIGKAAYRAVIVPSCLTIRHSTLALLLEFQKAGGQVIFAGTTPIMLEGENAEALKEFIAMCISCRIDAVEQYVEFCRQVSIADSAGNELSGVLYILRRHNDGCYLFICNTGYSLEQQADVTPVIGPLLEERRTAYPEVLIRLQADTAPPEEWDAMTGKRSRPELINSGIIRTALPPRSSRLYFFPFIAGTKLPHNENRITVKTEPLTGDWQISLNEPNVVVLDSPEYIIGDDARHSGMDVRQVDQLARERCGLPKRHSLIAQPWSLPENPVRQCVTLAYRIIFEHIPEHGIILGGEYHGGSIKANNYELKTTDFQWVDESLTFFAIPAEYLKSGGNEIEISAIVSETVSLETWYLLGDFGVRLNGKEIIVTAPVRSLAIGNWVSQGLPFYSGAVEYRRQLNLEPDSFLQITGFRGTLAQVLADGSMLGTLLQEPYEAALPAGTVEIIVRIFGSRHNSHGPLHSKSLTPYLGPSAFAPERSNYLGYWQLKDYGLTGNPCIVVKNQNKGIEV